MSTQLEELYTYEAAVYMNGAIVCRVETNAEVVKLPPVRDETPLSPEWDGLTGRQNVFSGSGTAYHNLRRDCRSLNKTVDARDLH